MNIADAIAFCAMVVGFITIASFIAQAYSRRLTNREHELEMRVRLAEAEANARSAGVPRVEERLRVLERIATDRKPALSDEIEALRTEGELTR